MQAGSKGQPVVLLMTDNQIVNEGFLVYINDLLSTGYIPDLCTPASTPRPRTAVLACCGIATHLIAAGHMPDAVDGAAMQCRP